MTDRPREKKYNSTKTTPRRAQTRQSGYGVIDDGLCGVFSLPKTQRGDLVCVWYHKAPKKVVWWQAQRGSRPSSHGGDGAKDARMYISRHGPAPARSLVCPCPTTAPPCPPAGPPARLPTRPLARPSVARGGEGTTTTASERGHTIPRYTPRAIGLIWRIFRRANSLGGLMSLGSIPLHAARCDAR